MKLLFSFIIFLNVLKIFFPLENENISNYNYNSYEIKIYSNSNNIDVNLGECYVYIEPLFNGNDKKKANFPEFIKCVINCSLYDISNLDTALILMKTFLKEDLIKDIEEADIKLMLKIVINATNSGIIEDFFKLMKNNTSILKDLLVILNENGKGEEMNVSNIYESLSSIFNIDGIYDILEKSYNQSRQDFLDLLGIIIKNNYEGFLGIYNIFIDIFKEYDADFLQLVFNIIKNYFDREALIVTVGNFLKSHKEIFPKIKDILGEPEIIYFFSKLLTITDQYVLAVKELIFSRNDTESINLFFSIVENDTLFDILLNILININNQTFLLNNVGPFFSGAVALNNSNVNLITNMMFDLAIIVNKNRPLAKMTITQAQEFIGDLFSNNDYKRFGVRQECLELFHYVFFDYQEQTKELFLYYFQKYLLDSSRGKGKLLSFDNCLNERNLKFTSDKYIIYPAYIITIVNYPELKSKSKNSSFYSKGEYINSFCFPYGFTNKEDEEKEKNPICSKEDYAKIIIFLISLYDNSEIPTVDSLLIYQNTNKPNTMDNLLGILALFFFFLPVIINIILVIYKKVMIRRQKTNILINELITDVEKREKNNIGKKETIKVDINKNERKRRFIFPNWYLYLKECFDIFKNGKELFNFSLNNTNYNNINGITYIKGLIGISIILTIYGHTFIAIANFPIKVYGLWEFYRIMKSFFYPLLYFGYKYCPRILFSCSGYTLIYKFLCYIEQEENFSLLKFIFLQSYKYILLILVLVFFKHMIYYVVILFTQEKRPVWSLFKNFIDKEDDFYKRFFSFLFQKYDDNNGIKQYLITYFYMPINEVFFFIFGTLLIFYGYKYKLRIDLYILILILIIYCSRIILYLLIMDPIWEYLTTIDYLFFDYGLFMESPMSNISCFLIGMYFGLINYSIQKGITELEKRSNYNNIILQMSEAEIPEDDEEKKFIKRRKSSFKLELETRIRKFTINNSKNGNEISNNNNIIYNNIREDDVKDINKKNNEKLEKCVGEDKDSKKIEYSDKIKKMPFLISPIKFSIFHRNNKSRCFLNVLIIIAILILLILAIKEIIITLLYIKPGEIPQNSNFIQALSFENLIPNPVLNFFNLIDIEIVVFIVQWITFILYFKEFEIIRSFINHIYWSFFVKSYFSFILVSIPIILFVIYEDETAIKLDIYTNVLFTLINTIAIIIAMIILYSFYELPLKKAFKFCLKGKELLNNEEDEEEEEEEKNDDDKVEKFPINDNDDDY